MVKKTDIQYEMDIQENTTIEQLQREYDGNIILWITGSGCNEEGMAAYRGILQYKSAKKYYEGQKLGLSANQAYIHGAIELVEHINKPSGVCIIVPVALGFESAFKNKGPNAALIQKLCEILKEKNCTLREVRFLDGAAAIKNYIYQISGNGDWLADKKEKKAEHVQRYKENIYRECIEKIIPLLEEANMDKEFIERVKNVRP